MWGSSRPSRSRLPSSASTCRTSRSPPPRALLLGFGDSALDFELRCVVANVDEGILVKSDLHFAILRSFRAAGIDIPYPQRELRFRGEAAVTAKLPTQEEHRPARKRG